MKRLTVQLHLANEKNLSSLIITDLSSVLEKYHPEQTKTERLERFDSVRVLIPSNWPTRRDVDIKRPRTDASWTTRGH